MSLGLAEIALRMFAPQPPSWLAIYRRHPELPFHALLPELRAPVDTGENRWSVRTNTEGFRVGGSPPKPTACTALWLGDSFAFGHGVDYEESLVGLIQARTPDLRHINAAVPGYGPVQYRQVLEYLLRKGLEPDFVFVATYVGNDFHDCQWDKDVWVEEGVIGHRGDWKSFLKSNLHLYRLVSATYHRLAPPGDSPHHEVMQELSDPEAWRGGFLAEAHEVFGKEMARLAQLGREHGAEVRFLVIPPREAVDALRGLDGSDRSSPPLLPVSQARSLLEAIGADVVDATPVLARSPVAELYFPFDGHLNREGNRRLADALVAAWPLTCDPRPARRGR